MKTETVLNVVQIAGLLVAGFIAYRVYKKVDGTFTSAGEVVGATVEAVKETAEAVKKTAVDAYAKTVDYVSRVPDRITETVKGTDEQILENQTAAETQRLLQQLQNEGFDTLVNAPVINPYGFTNPTSRYSGQISDIIAP